MSWQWSRLSILVFLALLYTSPLSSGDKGLWLSVTAMPVQPFGAMSGEMLPEHLILLPDRSRVAPATAHVEHSEPALGSGLLAANGTTAQQRSEQVGDTSPWDPLGEIRASPTAPRGPPA